MPPIYLLQTPMLLPRTGMRSFSSPALTPSKNCGCCRSHVLAYILPYKTRIAALPFCYGLALQAMKAYITSLRRGGARGETEEGFASLVLSELEKVSVAVLRYSIPVSPLFCYGGVSFFFFMRTVYSPEHVL